MSHDSENLEGHVYDGIHELDNPMPTWWVWTFFLTIVFAFIYFLHYGLGEFTLTDELKVAMAEIEKVKAQNPVVDESEEVLEKAMAVSTMQALGAEVFSAKCAVCHGQDLQGQIGPNLTDHYWLHGKGTRADLVKVVRQGVLDKGMPAWDQMLKKDEIYAVTAYILSKKDSNPANAKAAQGELVQ